MNELTTIPAPQGFNFEALDRAAIAASTRAKYQAALTAMLLAKINPLNRDELISYAQSLPVSGRAFLKAALQIVTQDTVNTLKASATPQNLATIQAALLRLEALQDAIPTHQPDPVRIPHWLTQEQVTQILDVARTQSPRDHAILAVLFGAGLRREELEKLTFDALRQIDGKPVLTVRGKGDKVRTIPVDYALATTLQQWNLIAGGGRIARRMDRHGNLYDSMSAAGIFNLVRKYGELIGIDDLDPHDCRRTFGRLVYNQTHDLLFVRDLLGHANAETTQHYIGLQIHTARPQILEEE